MLSSSMHRRADAEVAAGDEGFEAILRDPDVAGVLVVLPPHVGPQVRPRSRTRECMLYLVAACAHLSEAEACGARRAVLRAGLPAPPAYL